MSSSNCCFLTCIHVSQEAGQVVWYSHVFQNFPQFIVIHTVEGFAVVNKAEIDAFLELLFFNDPADVGNLISGSSAFSKTSLNIWNTDTYVYIHIIYMYACICMYTNTCIMINLFLGTNFGNLVLLLFSPSVLSDYLWLNGAACLATPLLHHLLELAQTHVHCVSDVIQPSHPLSSTSPPTFNLSQHQGLF